MHLCIFYPFAVYLSVIFACLFCGGFAFKENNDSCALFSGSTGQPLCGTMVWPVCMILSAAPSDSRSFKITRKAATMLLQAVIGGLVCGWLSCD